MTQNKEPIKKNFKRLQWSHKSQKKIQKLEIALILMTNMLKKKN